MHFDVEHLTDYRYGLPVHLGPQTLRMRPRPGGGLREIDYSLLVNPAPVLRTQMLDAAGNLVTRLCFELPTTHLRLVSRFTAETLPEGDGRLVLDPAHRRLPMDYPKAEAQLLAPYRVAGAPAAGIRSLAARLTEEANDDPVELLLRLTDWLHRRIEREIREEGAPQTPVETLERGKGACRDQAVLFAAVCRSVGIAARFVSGYQDRSALETDRRHLHAWAEAYIPGCGWRGFDPTRGIPVGEGHVAVAAAAEPSGAMPVDGSYFGAADSRLRYEVRIRATEA